MRSYRRQNPVSCHLCRSKKLKCDRQQPCSNCTARGVTCTFLQQARPGPRPPGPNSSQPDDATAHDTAVHHIPAILARLQRLEEAMASMGSERLRPGALLGGHGSAGAQPSPSDLRDVETRWEEYQSFERIGMRDRSLVFRKRADLRVTAAESVSARPAVAAFDPVSTSILLPCEADAVFLFEAYMQHVEHHHRIVHGPTVRALLSRLYASLPCDRYQHPGQVALLLAIFASTVFFWRLAPGVRPIFDSSEDALEAARTWGIAAIDILELSRRVTTGSLEDIQASVIGISTFHYAEGYSSHTRYLQNVALALARDLGLHKIDFPTRPRTVGTPGAAVENEIKRRIWWYLASRDWLLAFTGGHQEGTYTVQPRHMRVDYPQNVDDADIPVDGSAMSVSLSVPTNMSLFLQQIRLAEICRKITDQLPPFLAGFHHLEYDNILALDAEFQSFLDDLPPFLCLDDRSNLLSPQMYATHRHIACQRSLIHTEFHIRRSKLHQPFLLRDGAASYPRSRELCLSSAYAVLEANRFGCSEEGASACFGTRLAAVIHHIFMAAMTLVLELSYNNCVYKEDPSSALQYRSAVFNACTMLERAAQNTLMGKRFLNTFSQILQRHSVTTVTVDQRVGAEKEPLIENAGQDMNPASWMTDDNLMDANFNAQSGIGDEIGLNALLQGYIDLGSDFEVPMWQSLFADLESWNYNNF